jgi:hypothetical protein
METAYLVILVVTFLAIATVAGYIARKLLTSQR